MTFARIAIHILSCDVLCVMLWFYYIIMILHAVPVLVQASTARHLLVQSNHEWCVQLIRPVKNTSSLPLASNDHVIDFCLDRFSSD